ncbi:hypothetical protein AgCh_004150 [Apium graveolens]
MMSNITEDNNIISVPDQGLPFYDPRMSSSAYSDALLGFRTAFKQKKNSSVVGTGSKPHPEEGSESNAP